MSIASCQPVSGRHSSTRRGTEPGNEVGRGESIEEGIGSRATAPLREGLTEHLGDRVPVVRLIVDAELAGWQSRRSG